MDSGDFPPQILNYLGIRQYLSDYYLWRKRREPQFSYQAWSVELGFRNKSLLRLIVNGQRLISESSRQLFERGLPLLDLEKQYFTALVHYSQTRSLVVRQKEAARMSTLLKLHHDRVEIQDHIDFLSSPKIPALQVLLSFDDLERTPSQLAFLLNERQEQVEHWLNLLLKLKLAESDGNSIWKATHRNFRVSPDLGNSVIARFHADSLELASRVTSHTPETRRYRTLLCALTDDELELVNKRFNEFAMTLLSQFDKNQFADRRLYQINLAASPVSRPQKNLSAETS